MVNVGIYIYHKMDATGIRFSSNFVSLGKRHKLPMLMQRLRFPAIFQALYGGSTASRPLPQICEVW